MLVVAKKNVFWWPVSVKRPDPEKPGAFVEATFQAQFEAMPLDRAQELDRARGAKSEQERMAGAFDFLLEMVKGWRDVVDEDKTPIPFSPESLKELLQFTWFRDGILAAYHQAVSGHAVRPAGAAERPLQ